MDTILPKPDAQDQKNYSYSLQESPFHHTPDAFLKEGQRVRAKFRIWDTPNPGSDEGWGWISALPGEMGTCIEVDPGFWPVVLFDNTDVATCVTDFEVEAI